MTKIKDENQMSMHQFTKFLQDWDNSNKSKRSEILEELIQRCFGKTGPEIESYLHNGASLFLTRLTAWLRLTYMTSEHLKTQLQAVLLFVGATSGYKFLCEFIEVGGILTLLEILGLDKVKEVEKKEVLSILFVIASTGRKYKELICESFGIRAIAECLARSNQLECQEACKTILKELATANPKYENQVYKAMISLLNSASPEAQQISAQLLQYIQPSIETASISIIDPCLLLLRSLHLEVLYEACELIKLLTNYGNVRNDIINGLVGLLRPSKIDMEQVPDIVKDSNGPDIQAPLPFYIQQAAAGKIIGLLLKESSEFTPLFLKYEVIQNLLFAMSNDKYADSQKQAGLTLYQFIHANTEVEKKVRDAMGQAFFFQYMNNPDSFFINATTIHLDILAGNKVCITGSKTDCIEKEENT